MTHEEKARSLFLDGYNCAQAVFGAFAEELGMEQDAAMRLASSFGGGIGRQREVCGAVSGMCMAAGLQDGYAAPKDPEAKKAHYAYIRKLCDRFREENGSIVCRELLGVSDSGGAPTPRDGAFYQKRPCADLVACAARILKTEPRPKGE